MLVKRNLAHSRPRSRGMSLVELMVGIAVGLFVVAAAALMSSSQLVDNRALLLETQLQQDLRATAEFIARDLRRNGGDVDGTGGPTGGGIQLNAPNPDDTDTTRSVQMSGVRRDSVINGSELSYSYVTPRYPGSYRIRLSDNVIETCRSSVADASCNFVGEASGYQPLSDGNTVKITAFSISANQEGTHARTANSDRIALPCENLCTLDPTNGGATTCWPSVKVHELVVWLTGQSVADERITRTLKTTVRVRNPDWKIATPAGGVPSGLSCPDQPY